MAHSDLAVAAQVRERAAALVDRHAARLGMDAMAAGLLVRSIRNMSLTDIPVDGTEWVKSAGRDPGLPPATFVFARYEGESREEAEANTRGYGECASDVRWASVAEFRRKHPRTSN